MNYKKIQIIFFLAMLIGALYLTIVIYWPYVFALLFALILAVVFNPVYNKICSYFKKNRSVPAFLTVFLVFIIIMVPLIFAGIALVEETRQVVVNLQLNGFGSTEFLNKVQTYINETFPFAKIDLVNDSQSYLKSALDWVIKNLAPFVTNVVGIILGFFLTLFSLYYLLKDGHKFKQQLVIFSPLADKYDRQIFSKLALAVNSVMKGSILIAIIQGFLLGLGLWIFGVPNPILWGTLGVIVSLIPAVGTGVIVLPATIYLFATGHPVAAIGLLCWGVLLVGLIDNMLRPKLIEKDVNLHPLLIFLSVIGGLSVIGPFGFIVGPLILSLLFSLLDIYKQEFREYLK
jgi:predicted PurR-regulated permease PerM